MIPFAPLTIPTFLSDEWKSIGIGYLKNIMVYAVQGVLIFLIVSLVPLFESAGKIAVSNGAGVLQSLAIMFGSFNTSYLTDYCPRWFSTYGSLNLRYVIR